MRPALVGNRELAAADGDAELEAFVWGAGRAMRALLADDRAAAAAAFGSPGGCC